MDILKGKTVTLIVVFATVVLAGVAIYTALRLYQTRQTTVAPTAPESTPAALVIEGTARPSPAPVADECTLDFTLAEEGQPNLICSSKTASDSSGNLSGGSEIELGQSLTYKVSYSNNGDAISAGGTITDTLPEQVEFVNSDDCTYSDFTSTVTCAVGETAVGGSGSVSFNVKVSDTAGAGSFTNTATLTENQGGGSNCPITLNVVISGTSTPVPITCNESCTANSDCESGLICSNGSCRNSECTTETDCECPTSTVTPKPSATPGPTATPATPSPTEPGLPQAGIGTPTTIGLGAGLLILLFGLALAI